MNLDVTENEETPILERYSKGPSFEVIRSTGRKDLAEVFVARFSGNRMCEFVDGMDPSYSKEEKWIINISTQFGCPVGCPYCDAGSAFEGNLRSGEMLETVEYVIGRNQRGLADRCAKLKVHFSRMGEPALNDEVLAAVRALRKLLPNPNLWICVATTAPKEREKWFNELRWVKNDLFQGRFQLQFSLNSTSAEERNRLVPIPHLSMKEIADYGKLFFEKGDRKIVLNFALAKNVSFDEQVISSHFDPDFFCVKLTPVNPTFRGRKNGFETVLRSYQDIELEKAIQHLRTGGFDVILSIGDAGEDDIGSNCGQAVQFESMRAS